MKAAVPPPPSRPLTDYYTTFEVKARGWSATMISKLMPRADAARPPWPQPGVVHRPDSLVRLYLKVRVEEEETTEEFLITGAAADKARQRGATNGQSHRLNEAARLAAYMASFKPRFTWAKYNDLPAETGQLLEIMKWERRHHKQAESLGKRLQAAGREAVLEKSRSLFKKKFPDWVDPPSRSAAFSSPFNAWEGSGDEK